MKRLDQKVALVTGGSRGIGAAIVRRLAAEGAKVAFTYNRSGERAKQLATELEEEGGRVLPLKADCANVEELQEAVDKTAMELGGLDILVNNAGIYLGKPFEEHTLEDYEYVMAVNVRAVYAATRAAVGHLSAGGRVITIGSGMADYAMSPATTLYTMSKSALQGFTRGLARDLGPREITVNLIQPGPVDTEMNPAGTPLADFLTSHMARPQYGKGEDISAMVAFLASSEAGFVTGTALTVDGGLNA